MLVCSVLRLQPTAWIYLIFRVASVCELCDFLLTRTVVDCREHILDPAYADLLLGHTTGTASYRFWQLLVVVVAYAHVFDFVCLIMLSLFLLAQSHPVLEFSYGTGALLHGVLPFGRFALDLCCTSTVFLCRCIEPLGDVGCRVKFLSDYVSIVYGFFSSCKKYRFNDFEYHVKIFAWHSLLSLLHFV